jgi:hypothetical protein
MDSAYTDREDGLDLDNDESLIGFWTIIVP